MHGFLPYACTQCTAWLLKLGGLEAFAMLFWEAMLVCYACSQCTAWLGVYAWSQCTAWLGGIK